MKPSLLPRWDCLLSAEDFIAHQEKAGVFSDAAAMPENDPRILRRYIELLQTQYPEEAEFAVRVFAGRYGFFLDPVDAVRDGLNWAMTTPVIDMCIGVTWAEFVKDLPRLCEEADVPILTDSFSFTDGFGGLASPLLHLIRLNSPVADIAMPFADYLESLTSERRKKYRRLVQDFDGAGLTFDLSAEALSMAETDFILDNLTRKWGEEAGYAFRQTLWFLAVQKIRPAHCHVMRVRKDGVLVFVQTMIVKDIYGGGYVTCQSIAKNEDMFFSGIAAYTDFKCIEALCGAGGYGVFDPSCRTSLSDPDSIGVAKRATVNRNLVKPLLAINVHEPEELRNVIESPVVQGREV